MHDVYVNIAKVIAENSGRGLTPDMKHEKFVSFAIATSVRQTFTANSQKYISAAANISLSHA